MTDIGFLARPWRSGEHVRQLGKLLLSQRWPTSFSCLYACRIRRGFADIAGANMMKKASWSWRRRHLEGSDHASADPARCIRRDIKRKCLEGTWKPLKPGGVGAGGASDAVGAAGAVLK